MATINRHVGGLADRLRGMLTTYQYCKEHNLCFKIHHIFAFDISKFLAPNQYDWTIPKNEISYNSRLAVPVDLNANTEYNWLMEDKRSYATFEYALSRFHKPQVHVYSNCMNKTEFYHEIFNELFVPTPLLANALQPHADVLASGYVSISFRFQSLLGDFKDSIDTPSINTTQQQVLIDKMLAVIDNIKQQHNVKKVLITADSIRFRSIAAHTYDYVYVVEGVPQHINRKFGADEDINVDAAALLAFVDFFLIRGAQKAYHVVAAPMYRGGFARVAAFTSGIPFEYVDVE
jgi:hypothetical protein